MKENIGFKPDPYLLKRFLVYGFLFIFVLTAMISLCLSSNIAHGYESDSVEIAILDYIFPHNQSVRLIHELIEGQTAYIVYEDGLSEIEEPYSIAAIDLSDQNGFGILWTLSFPEYINDLTREGSLLYITTSTGGLWGIDLEAPDVPELQELDTSQEIRTKKRFRIDDSLDLNQYNFPQYQTNSYFDNWNNFSSANPWATGLGLDFPQAYSWAGSGSGFPQAYPWSTGSGLGFFQNYQLPNWSQTNLWTQSLSPYSFSGAWNSYSFPGSFQSYLPQSTMLSVSPFSFSGQYAPGGWPYTTSNSGMTSFTGVPSFTGAWSPIIPWQGYTQTSTSSPKITRYRSPVPATLPLNNPSNTDTTGQITLRLKDLNGKTVSEQKETLTIEQGSEDYPLTLNKVPEGTDTEDFAKYNLWYSFAGSGVTLTEQKSLFQVADKMEVRLLGPDSMYAGQITTLGVHAFVHGRPVSLEGATVTVDLINASDTKRLYSDATDDNGFAEAVLDIPENSIGSWEIRARVSSDLGSETITEDIEIIRLYKVLLTTDKPIYQPGHTIHIRTLTLKKPDLLPEAGKEIIIEVEDPKGNKVFRVDLLTDEFGVAFADFTLGTDINLGLYTVRAIQIEDGISTQSEKKVTVERYVLPKFKVDLETDAEFYSPGDNVHGVVHAGYFFGKDLSDATVTIEASKFDVDFVPFQTITGHTDAYGFFSFDLTLPGYFVGLPLEQGNAFVKLDIKVEDTAEHEEAIVRELTVTKDPILIKLVPESGSIVLGVENILYIITTDPKGRGLATTNLISFDGQILDVNTDAQGVGSFTVTPDEGSTLLFQIASQADGQSALVEIDLSGEVDQARILLRTDKAIYTVGETMTIDVSTPEFMARRVFMDIIRDRQTLLTEGVDINSGQGQLIVDLSNDMAGTLLVEAYYISLATETASDIFRDKKIVYVNPADDIQVTVALDKDQYLPGEKAIIEFQVSPPQTAALGITIVDEAVYALQENKPGLLKVYFSMEEEIMKPRFWPLIVPYEEAVTSYDPDEEVQEMAEIVFASVEEPDDPGLDESSYPDLVRRMKEALVSRIDKDADKVAKDLGNQYIYSESAYNKALGQGKIKTYKDPWGNLYKLEVGHNQVILTSNGPDEKEGTMDDISLTKPYERVYKPSTNYGGWGGWGWGGYGGYGGYVAYGAYSSSGGGSTGGTYVPEASAGFLNPTGQEGEEPPGEEIETQEPRKIRRDFPETLLWEPSLITDPNGMAYMDANMADSITTWRMSTIASTLEGKLGGHTEGIVVFQDFFIDIDLPVTLTQNDEISMPVAIYNYLDEPQIVRIKLEVDQNSPWFELLDENEKQVDLEAGQVTVEYFRVKALDVGWHELTVFGYGTRMSDAMARRIEVLPDGLEFNVNVSDRLKGNETSHVLHIPTEAIDEASKILVKVYPGIFSQIVEGLDKLFKVPHGCFTQSTTVTWPNVLVLDYMITTDQLTPEIEMKAREYINLGYQRLLTFECPNGGFSWYGNEPGKPILTAYGLMEFTDMERVHYVDPAMIQRTQEWLLGKQEPDGSWPPDKVKELFNVLNNSLQSTAYATWALIHSGYSSNDSSIIKGKDFVKSRWENTEDNYTLALCAHALLEGNSTDPAGLSILNFLEGKKIVEGDTVYWTSNDQSFTYSKGNYLNIETTAMITLAMIKAGWRYPQSIDGAINYIVQKKEAFGNWGQTQATVLSLRVLMEAMSGQTGEIDAELVITINGVTLDKDDLPILEVNPIDTSVLRLIELQPYTMEGDNTIGISLIGTGNLLYQIVGTYFLPWQEVILPSSPPLSIDLEYDRTTLTVDDTILCTVTVTNNILNSVTRMGMIDLGIPPGFRIFWEDFQKAIEEEKIFKYESTNRQLSLYLHPIPYGEPLSITYRLQAKYPLKVSTTTSSAYDYYNPDVKDETKPVILTVTQ